MRTVISIIAGITNNQESLNGERIGMKNIVYDKNGMRVSFRINEDRTVELVDFSAISGSFDMANTNDDSISKQNTSYQFLALQQTGESSTDMHAYKHNAGSESSKFRYLSHTMTENECGLLLCITMETDKKLKADYYMQLYKHIRIARTWATITNGSRVNIGLDYVSSFIYEGLCKNGTLDYYDKTELLVPYNSWSNEAQWHTYDIKDIGLSSMPIKGHNLPDMSNNRFHYGNCGSWSSCEHLPMGMIKDCETGEIYYYQIEHSGSWEIEIGSAKGEHLYLAMMGPNDESMWWKNLVPGESFTTVPAAFGVTLGDESDAVAELTKYRREIRRKNRDDEACNVVFNDYMNCLMGDPTEKNEKLIIDKAAEMGCEYYCMDCGWYDKGNWWDRVGEWKESLERFPDGMKSVCDYAHSKGLRMGLWLEIEVMGTACPLAKKLPDDWFFCLHGKRRVDNKRYLLDFRNPEVRAYCADTVDRLIKDYGIEYFKIDYNVTTGPGSDLKSDSYGDALLDHYRYLYGWYKEIYRKHPDIVIENCGSGAQRMDYGMLSLQSLQSTSDQTDTISNSYIAANVASAITPEQAGMWVYPYNDDSEHVIYNMVNGILLRPYISGLVWNISDDNFELIKEGIKVYKGIRGDFKYMTPFFPLGFATVSSKTLAYGLVGDNKAFLSIFGPKDNHIKIDLNCLKRKIETAKIIYPHKGKCDFALKGNVLEITMPQTECARLFEITLM